MNRATKSGVAALCTAAIAVIGVSAVFASGKTVSPAPAPAPVAQSAPATPVVQSTPATPVQAPVNANPVAPGGSSVPVAAQHRPPSTDSVQVSKCYTNATLAGGGELLIKARSSDASAHLFAYRPDGSLIGELQNGGGNRYGGTVMPYQASDPVNVTIRSSAGGAVTVLTTPFQL